MICPFCGYVFVTSSATRALEKDQQEAQDEQSRWGTARFNQRMKLVLRLNGKAEFAFDPAKIDLLVIGRRDTFNGDKPTVDLNDYDAENQGVSRRHALIKRTEASALTVIDQGSINGTFLNGQRLIPHQPRILRDGDELRLGRLVLNVSFNVAD